MIRFPEPARARERERERERERGGLVTKAGRQWRTGIGRARGKEKVPGERVHRERTSAGCVLA